MSIERRDEGEVTILSLHGTLEASNLPTLNDAVERVKAEGRTRIVFNLHGVEFMNSSVLGFVINTGHDLVDVDGEIALSQPSEFIAGMLESLGLSAIFRSFATDAEAVAYLRGP